jgi:hypothetical protein
MNGRMGKWTADECSKLKGAVQTRGGKSWVEIAILVPGRTDKQCRNFYYGYRDDNPFLQCRTRLG